MTARKIEAMHAAYGISSDHKCKDCNHLCCHEYSRYYYKCRLYGLSASDATDWRVGWTACGMWGKEAHAGIVPILERLKHASRPKNQPIAGQLDMFGKEFGQDENA